MDFWNAFEKVFTWTILIYIAIMVSRIYILLS